ncbi:MAG: PAS domain-containing protein [Clostridiaceae bacterium]|nr:PAS domain-containing protein [Clostridiaceae bacterium]
MVMNPILENYVAVANMIADTFGDHCEVILHDFSIPQNSVVYTRNNVVTNRQVGQSFTEYFVKEVLLSRKFRDDVSANYIMKGAQGQTIKSSTVLIRDDGGKVIGSLCVNLDITYMKDLMDQFISMMGIEEPTEKTEEEVAVLPNIQEIVDDIIEHTIGDQNMEELSRDQKIDLVRFMDDKGLFLIKGAADKVAERMNISKVTVYSYLDEIRKNK